MTLNLDHSLEFAPYFRKAFAYAQKGRGQVEPNPLVGAVVLEGEKIVGRGYHHFFGGSHAEIEALRDAQGRGTTLVVTLEPCSVSGKTPSCTKAILGTKIRTIVVGAVDPFPKHRGKGLEDLKKSGRRVIQVNFQEEWEKQNRSFLKFLKLNRPWVIAKWAMTLDGKTASSRGDSKWISSPASREEVWKLRGRCEAVVTGVGTILADDPLLSPRNHLELKQAPFRVVFDSMLRTPLESKLVRNKGGKTILIASKKAAKIREKRLVESGCEVIRPGDKGGKPSVPRALELLRARGITRVLLEGGAKLTAAFLAEKCMDQVIAYLAPKVVGGERAPTPLGGQGISEMQKAIPVVDWFWEGVSGDLKIVGFL